MRYRVKNYCGDYCNVFVHIAANISFPIRTLVDECFETTDINVANEYRQWLELAYPTYKFTVVEVSE